LAQFGVYGSLKVCNKVGSFGEPASLVTTRILLVDDFDQWRLAARSMLEEVAGFRVIGESSDGLDAVAKAATLFPDVIVLDIGMPLLNGIEAARRIRLACLEARIVFLTENDDEDVRCAALATGAMGYVLKSSAAYDLLPTVERALLRAVPASILNWQPL
jgi:DNA-binding NarL/FixJ family response regulator